MYLQPPGASSNCLYANEFNEQPMRIFHASFRSPVLPRARGRQQICWHCKVGSELRRQLLSRSNTIRLVVPHQEPATPGGVQGMLYKLQQGVVQRVGTLSSPHDSEIMRLAGPAAIATLMEPLQALFDTACVGRLGTEPLAAVGLGTLLVTFGVSFFTALQVVTTTGVASHAAQEDREQASLATAKASTLAVGSGIAMSALLLAASPIFVHALGGHSSMSDLALEYIAIRSWALPAALLMLTGTGAARGLKDPTTPLVGACAQYGTNLVLDLVLIFGLDMGVAGAAAAATVGQYVGAAVVFHALLRQGDLQLQHLSRFPALQDVKPYAEAGALLSSCNIAGTSVAMAGTALATEGGIALLAAHTVLRQIMTLCTTSFACFSVATQSLVASSLGAGCANTARSTLLRTAQLGGAVAVPLAVLLACSSADFVHLFSQDVAVVDQVLAVLPILLICMPLDAVGAVAEGGLLASLQVPWVTKRTWAGSAASLAAVLGSHSAGTGLWGLWVGTKLLNVATLTLDAQHLLSGQTPLGKISAADMLVQHGHSSTPGLSVDDPEGQTQQATEGRSAKDAYAMLKRRVAEHLQ